MEDRSLDLTKQFRFKSIAKLKMKLITIGINLTEGGDKNAQVCGWLKDKFGVSWQVVPNVLVKMLQDKDSKKTENVMRVMLQMQKLDINALTKAYQQS